MVDLNRQYQEIQSEVDSAILDVVASGQFINGPAVHQFADSLASYLDVKHVIPCANGTDALQIALMALDLTPGDEVIVPAFTYVATAEVIALLRLTPVMIDVCPDTFNIKVEDVKKAITSKTKVIVPVHLFGQCTDLEKIVELANEKGIYIIEDNAQSIGSKIDNSEGHSQMAGTIGDIGTTSFYPAKNLGAYGDGGALFTNSEDLAKKIKMIANHGQSKRYYHDLIGCNSRLDSIQAAVLDIKLKNLNRYADERQALAAYYDKALSNIQALEVPFREMKSSHVFHQYTLKVKDNKRDGLAEHLKALGIPFGIYYPLPLYAQKAFATFTDNGFSLPITEQLCKEVISLPMHPHMTEEIKSFITQSVQSYFEG